MKCKIKSILLEVAAYLAEQILLKKNKQLGWYFGLIGLVVVTGCQPRVEKGAHEEADYGVVAPGQVDPGNGVSVDKMFIPLDELPPGEYSLERMDDGYPNKEKPEADQAVSADFVPDPRLAVKNALEARRLSRIAERLNARREDAFKRIIELCREGLNHDPNMVRLHELAAEAYLSLAQNQRGIYHALKALELDPHNLSSWQILGAYHITKGEFDQARSCYQRALLSPMAKDLNSTTLVLYMQCASSLTQAGYYQAAIDAYQRALELIRRQQGTHQVNPEAAKLVYNEQVPLLLMADLAMKMGDIAQVVNLLESAQEEIQFNRDLMDVFIQSLAEQKAPIQDRFDRVRMVCRYLLARGLRQNEVLRYFYAACQEMAYYEPFLEQITQWYNTEPWFDARLYSLGLYLADRPQAAIEALEKALRDNRFKRTEVIDALRRLGGFYGELGQWLDMIHVYGQIIDLKSDLAVQLWLEVEEQIRVISDPQEVIRRGMAREEILASPGCSFLLAGLCEQARMDDYAEDLYRRAIESPMLHDTARSGLARLMLRQKRYDEVLAWLGQNPSDERLLQAAGEAYLKLGELDQAEAFYARLAANHPQDIQSRLIVGDIQMRRGDLVQAEQTLLGIRFNWPANREVCHKLFLLYVNWGDRPNLIAAFRRQCDQAARKMLDRYLLFYRETDTETVAQAHQETLAELDRMIAGEPAGYLARLYASELSLKQGDADQAARLVETESARYPNEVRVLQQAIAVYLFQKRYQNAYESQLTLWRQNTADNDLFKQVLETGREAGAIEETFALLLEQSERTDRSNSTLFEVMDKEARWLFHITRAYEQAWTYYQRWLGSYIESEQSQRKDKYYPDILEELIWSGVLSGQYDSLANLIKKRLSVIKGEEIFRELWAVRYLAARNEYDLALELAGLCMDAFPEELTPHTVYYQVLIDAGHKQRAVDEARKWLEEAPGQVMRRSILLYVYRAAGDYQAAIDLILELLKQDESNSDLKIRLANFYTLAKRTDDAGLTLNELAGDQEVLPYWLEARIQLDIALGSWQKAFSRLDELRGVNAELIERNRISILVMAGEYQEAIDRQKKLVAEHPDDYARNITLSVIYDKAGQVDQSLAVLENLLTLRPNDPLVTNNLGYSLIESHREPERAVALIRLSLEKDPDSGATLDSLGWYYYKMGDFKQAYDLICQGAAYVGSMDLEVLDHLGDVVWRLGERDRALHYWQLALENLARRTSLDHREKNRKALINGKIEALNRHDDPIPALLFHHEDER